MSKTSKKLRKKLVKEPYVWPGAYPQFAITDDGGCLCVKCCKLNKAEIKTAVPNDGWNITVLAINYESDIQCDNCNEDIEAAYIDPCADDDDDIDSNDSNGNVLGFPVTEFGELI